MLKKFVDKDECTFGPVGGISGGHGIGGDGGTRVVPSSTRGEIATK